MGIYTKSLNGKENMILTEESIYRSDGHRGKKDKYTISIHMDGSVDRDKGFYEDPYIKVCNANSWNGADKSIRFSMKTGKIIDSHSDGKGQLDCTKNFAEFLNTVLDSQTTCNKYKGMTVYDAFYESIRDRFPSKNITKFPKPDFKVNF